MADTAVTSSPALVGRRERTRASLAQRGLPFRLVLALLPVGLIWAAIVALVQ